MLVACAYVPPGRTRYTFRKLSVTSEQRVIYREAPLLSNSSLLYWRLR